VIVDEKKIDRSGGNIAAGFLISTAECAFVVEKLQKNF